MTDVRYQFEYERRVRCAFIGAGGHAFRNVYPSLAYAPVDLVAVCDHDGERAGEYARLFGAARSYTDHRVMLEAEAPEAVFIVTGYDPDGRVQATALAADCLAAGAHVWMEKPTAACLAEIDELERASSAAGKVVMTGLKKIFTPVMDKATEIIASDEFGGLSSLAVRYPQALPHPDHRDDLNAMRSFLDHIYHPAAVLGHLAGQVVRFVHEWDERTGASTATLAFASGAVGTLHLAAGASATAPLERVEAIGNGASLVIDNGIRLTYHRPAPAPRYGRSASWIGSDDNATLVWEPEFSLGQLYNKNLFYAGYVPEIAHFCHAVQTGTAPTRGTLADSRAIMRLFDAYRTTPPGTVTELPI